MINELAFDPDTGRQESPLAPGDVRLVPGVARQLSELRDAGHTLVCVSNQPAAAKGSVEIDQLTRVHERVLEMLEEQGVRLDSSQLCFHHPCGREGPLRRRCECRKPAPGMLLSASLQLGVDLSSSWMVGDTDTDVQAGRAAGVRTILVRTEGSSHKRSGFVEADHEVSDLGAATRVILGALRSC